MKLETNDRYGLKAKFEVQDQELLAAYRRAQKFRIKDHTQLKHGWMINIRETGSLSNCLVEKFLIVGKPWKDKDFPSETRKPWQVEVSLEAEKKKCRYISQENKVLEYISTLCTHNHGYRHNSKVQQFVELLIRSDRFQQHCVLNNRPYTEEEFNHWRFSQHMQKDMDEYFSSRDYI